MSWDPVRKHYNEVVDAELRKLGATDEQIKQFHKNTANVMSNLLMDWFRSGERRAHRFAREDWQ